MRDKRKEANGVRIKAGMAKEVDKIRAERVKSRTSYSRGGNKIFNFWRKTDKIACVEGQGKGRTKKTPPTPITRTDASYT